MPHHSSSHPRRLLKATLLWAAAAVLPARAGTVEEPPRPSIHVDIPVTLKQAKVVFNLDHLAFAGDMPVGMKYMGLLANRLKELKAEGDIVGVFHGDAAYLTLNDRAYNAYRQVATGNPYKEVLADLQRRGIHIEECAVSMKAHGWTNADLLPGVKVNAGAVGRIIQLVQEGYVQIQP